MARLERGSLLGLDAFSDLVVMLITWGSHRRPEPTDSVSIVARDSLGATGCLWTRVKTGSQFRFRTSTIDVQNVRWNPG